MDIFADLQTIIPELFLVCVAFLTLLFGLYSKSEDLKKVHQAAIGFLMLTLAVIFTNAPEGQTLSFNDMIITDTFGFFFKVILTIGSIATLSISLPYLRNTNMDRFEYPVLIMLALVGIFIMISAHSLLTLYMGLELQSLSLYILAAMQRNNVRSSEAGLKYFVLGALSSGFLLFGISLLYGYTGSLDYKTIALALGEAETISQGAIVGMVFILAAMAFKISAVPFHVWAPDVYEGAPTSVTAFFASVPKLAAFALLIRLLYGPFEALIVEWKQILYLIALLSMLVGAFAALTQNNIKRLLAFSSIGNVGYALIGLATGLAGGLNATILYLVIYLIMTLGIFAVILCWEQDGKMIENIDDMAGLAKTNPVLSYVLAILMFSIAGIPPMAGFFAKLYVFQAAVDAGYIYLAVIGILTSVVAAYYYLRIIKVMFFDEGDVTLVSDQGLGKPLVYLATTAFVLLYILSPGALISLVQQAVSPFVFNG